jgi:hypothetical protein
LDGNILDTDIGIDGFSDKIFRKDRNSFGGGVLVYPDFDGYHYQESVIVKVLKSIGYLSKRESDRFVRTCRSNSVNKALPSSSSKYQNQRRPSFF